MTDQIDKILSCSIDDIKSQANKTIEEGAVTKDYPLNIEEACQLLNAALATEIMCVLRYKHHQIIAKSIDYIQVANEFKEHAHEEEKHAMMLAERIDQLGGNPDFNPASVVKNSTTEYGSQTHLRDMIKEDLVAERIAISFYRKLIDWFGSDDPTTRRMLEYILKEEEDHASELADLLDASKE